MPTGGAAYSNPGSAIQQATIEEDRSQIDYLSSGTRTRVDAERQLVTKWGSATSSPRVAVQNDWCSAGSQSFTR